MSNTKKAARMAAFLLALIMSLSMALQAVFAEPVPDEGQAEVAEELQAAEGVLEGSETDPFITASFPEEGPETDALEGEPEQGEGTGEKIEEEIPEPERIPEEPKAVEVPETPEPAEGSEAGAAAGMEGIENPQDSQEEEAGELSEAEQPEQADALEEERPMEDVLPEDGGEVEESLPEEVSPAPEETLLPEENKEEATAEGAKDPETDAAKEPSEETPEEETEARSALVQVKVSGEGGSAVLTDAENTYLIQSTDGEVLVTDAAGNAVLCGDADYDLVLTEEIGSFVEITVQAEEGYRICEYRYSSNGTELSAKDLSEDVAEIREELTVPEDGLFVFLSFETAEKDPYFISEDFDYSIYSGLDFSSGRLLVATWDPSIFVDPEPVISGYQGIYLLQYADTNTALRAYAYYTAVADFVELDGTIFINDDAYLEEGDPVYGRMTESSNPFSELEEAIYTSGFGSFDIALIDTGAAGADESVSMLGGYAGDDNGHGSAMLEYIREQNPNARVLSIKAMDAAGQGDMSAVYAAIQYALTKDVRIISLSISAFAATDNGLLHSAIQQAVGSGIIVVASAGNNGRDASWYVPGGYYEVLTVGACDKDGVRQPSSNFGETVDYNLVAETTSEAAARMSGWLSSHSIPEIQEVLNDGLIYEAAYTVPEPEGVVDREILVQEDAGKIIASETAQCIDGKVTYMLHGSSAVQYVYAVMPIEEYDSVFVNDKLVDFELDDQAHTIIMTLTEDYIERAEMLVISEVPVTDGTDSMFRVTDSTVTVTDAPKIYFLTPQYEQGADRYFVLDNGAIGYCGDYNSSPPWVGAEATPYESSDINLLKVLYYGADGPGQVDPGTASQYANTVSAFTQDVFRCFTSMATSIAMTGYQGLPILSNIARSFYEYLVSLPAPSGAKAYVMTYGSGYQPVAFVMNAEKGNVSFTKSASDNNGTLSISKTAVTEDDPDKTFSFTLEYGATTGYGATKTFTLKGGQSASYDIPAGSYYRVTEADYSADGWVTSYRTGNGSWTAGRSVTGRMPAGEAGSTAYSFVAYGFSGEHDWYINDAKQGSRLKEYDLINIGAGDVVTIMDVPAGSTVTVTEVYPLFTYTGRDLANGMSGGDVYGAQKVLIDAGYLTVGADGSFGSYTEAAVKAFQSGNGITADGQIGQYTAGYLNHVNSSSHAGRWSGGGSVSGTAVKDTTTDLGTVYNTYEPDDASVSFRNEQTILKGDVSFAKETRSSTAFLTVSKEQAGEILFDDEFEFTLTVNGSAGAGYPYTGSRTGTTGPEGTFKLIAGESVTITGIPAGASYQVEEAQVLTASGNPKFKTHVTDDAGTTHEGRSVSGTTGSAPESTKFTFTVTGLPAGSYGYTIYNSLTASGTAAGTGTIRNNGTISLSGGQSVKITGIAQGSSVTVTETVPSGWTCSQAGNNVTGTVVKNMTAFLGRFTNTYAVPGQSVKMTNELDVGYVTLQKASQSDLFCEDNRLYSVEGAVYEIYSNMALTSKVAVLTTKADGSTDLTELPAGTYYVIETIASPGHVLDNAMVRPRFKTVQVTALHTAEDPALIESVDDVLNDPLRITITKNGGDYLYALPLEGAVFEVKYYDNLEGTITEDPVKTWHIKTLRNAAGEYAAMLDDAWLVEGSDALYKIDGTTRLPIGTYSVEEKSTASGYTLSGGFLYANTDPDTKVDSDGGKLIFVVSETDGAVNITTGNEYTGYNRPVEMHTTASGSSQGGAGGTHYLDASAGSGVIVDTVAFKNLDEGVRYRLTGQLYDRDTGETFGYTVSRTFTAQSAEEESQTLRFGVTDLAGMAGHVLVVGEVLEAYVEGGWIKVAEETDLAQEEQSVHIVKIGTTLLDTDTDDHVAQAAGDKLVDHVAYEGLIRGESYTLKAQLKNQETGRTVASAEMVFEAEAESGTVEVLFAYTPAEGQSLTAFEELYFDGSLIASHKDLEDEGQSVHVPKIRTSLKDSVDHEADAFAKEDITLVDTVSYENLLPGKEYTVKGVLMLKSTGEKALDDNGEEIAAESSFTPEEADGTVDITFTFSGVTLAGRSVVAFEALEYKGIEVAVHKDLEDADQTVDIPKIETTLEDAIDGEKDALASEDIELLDTVLFENLIAGREYTVRGILMDKETGEPALDDDGNEITAETVFTPDTKDGSVDVVFRFSGLSLKGHTVVAFEDLSTGTKQVAVHADLEDEDQTLAMPKIGTILIDTVDGDKDALASETIVLMDTVSYENLQEGRAYRVSGILMDKETGEPALDDDGKEIISEAAFIAEDPSGEIALKFAFRGVILEGHTVIAFERLYREEKLVALHCDIEDTGQSLSLPKIETSLKDTADGEHDAFAAETIRLIDTVTYTNLFPDREYIVTGKLYEKKTGEPVLDDNGREITALAAFMPVSANGTVDLLFEFSGISLAGHSVVAFEEVTRDGKTVAVHADIEDEEQTVDLPAIHTTLIDRTDGEQDALASEETTLTDVVAYENLQAGRTYTVKGKLMDKDTGLPAFDDDGNEIAAETAFTAETENGTVEVIFAFKGISLAGHTTVAFETLYREEKEVAVHADLEDEGQTAYFPKIETTLKDSLDSEHDALAAEDIVLIDEMRYSNLLPGRTYTVRGVLMDKETGASMLDDAGNEITAQESFTPETPDGSVDITFTFRGVTLAGHTTVAFETLYRDEKEVAVHADIEDEDQTVTIPEIKTTLADAMTGLHNTLIEEEITLTDTVAYSNLTAGCTYTMRGTLMDKMTGKAMKNKDGKDVTSEMTFLAENENGTVSLSFVLDNIPEHGMTVVAYEKLFRVSLDGKSEKEVAVHEDLEDKEQTVAISMIRTTLKGEGGLDTVNGTGTITLTDTVEYKNLIPGHEYTMKGKLMNKDTGEEMTDASGSIVTAETIFTAEESAGTVEVIFTFQAPDKICRELVAFESLYEGDVLIAEHEDLEDEAQAVNVLSLKTLAAFRNGSKRALSYLKQTVTDTITYSQLEPGTYIIRTMLMKKETGSPMTSNGVPVTAQATVELAEKEGEVSVDITIPAGTLLGDAVVFEEFYQLGTDGKEVLVGEHKDISDAAQTVSLYTDHTPPVRTGDESHMMLYASFAIAAFIILGICVVLLVRKRGRKG
ncbi:MAG: VaFE repeat-containing surface-anchored protein [Parasporobacterium sp.]|nr:VaFE repeat-containing surface-anchored protein [Parasporobacterium sp.]